MSGFIGALLVMLKFFQIGSVCFILLFGIYAWQKVDSEWDDENASTARRFLTKILIATAIFLLSLLTLQIWVGLIMDFDETRLTLFKQLIQ